MEAKQESETVFGCQYGTRQSMAKQPIKDSEQKCRACVVLEKCPACC